MFYLFISLSVLLISSFFFRRAAGTLSLLKPNIINLVFWYGVFLTTFIGAVFAVTGFNEHYMLRGLSEESIFYGWLMVLYACLAMPLGMFISMALFNIFSVKKTLYEYTKKSIKYYYFSRDAEEKILFWLTFISIASCCYVFYVNGFLPIIKVFQLESEQIARVRLQVSREFGGIVYVRSLLALQLMPLLSYFWFSSYLSFSANKFSRRKFYYQFLFFITFFLSINILFYNFEKSPVLWFFIGFYVLAYLAGKKINYMKALKILSLVLFFLVSFYLLAGAQLSELAQYNRGPIGRLLFSQIAGLYHYLDIYPSQHEFLGVSSLSKIVTALGVEYSDSAGRIAMSYFNPTGYAEGTSNVLSTFFIGEAWANFGLLGALISPLWVGFYLQTILLLFIKSKKTPLFLALLTYLTINTKITSGFNVFIYNSGLLFWVVVFTLIVFFARSLTKTYGRKRVIA